VKRGERQNDQGHNLFHRGTKHQAAYQWVFRHKTQLPADPVENRSSRTRNKEMQEHAQSKGAHAFLKCLWTEKAAGNRERNLPAKEKGSLRQVQNPGNPAACSDC
jgi:hypothetical protein